MGLYIRKSITVGPLRFNLSKSGVGVSAGVKGFRVGYGPRGNYVHMGVGGLYYKTTFPTNKKNGNTENIVNPPLYNTDNSPVMQEIATVDSYKIVDSSSADLVKEMNEKRQKILIWPFMAVFLIIAIMFGNINSVASVIIDVLLFALIIAASVFDQLRKTTVLFYEIESDTEVLLERLLRSFDSIANCSAAWHISAVGQVTDWKRNAGAGHLVNRKNISLTVANPPYIKTNVATPCIPLGKQTLYFFPDKIIIVDGNSVGALSYKNLQIDSYSGRFIEDGNVPRDAQVVDKTWKFVNKKGGPDKRFNNNRELPIVLYEETSIKSHSGLNGRLQLSKVGVMSNFEAAISKLASISA